MKNSVEKVNANIKDKRLTKIFLQGCTWTTKHNIVKMYLSNRYCRSNGHTEMNYENQVEDNTEKIRILKSSGTNYYYYHYFSIGKFDFLP